MNKVYCMGKKLGACINSNNTTSKSSVPLPYLELCRWQDAVLCALPA